MAESLGVSGIETTLEIAFPFSVQPLGIPLNPYQGLKLVS